jgi:hypothetical protein
MFSDFIIKDAYANFEHVGLIFGFDIVFLQLLFILQAILLTGLLYVSGLSGWNLKDRLSALKSGILLFGCLIFCASFLVSFVHLDKDPKFPLADENRSPVLAFSKTTSDFFFTSGYETEDADERILKVYSLHIQKEQDYPLLKNWVYKDFLPFEARRKENNINIIVFLLKAFSEEIQEYIIRSLKNLPLI